MILVMGLIMRSGRRKRHKRARRRPWTVEKLVQVGITAAILGSSRSSPEVLYATWSVRIQSEEAFRSEPRVKLEWQS